MNQEECQYHPVPQSGLGSHHKMRPLASHDSHIAQQGDGLESFTKPLEPKERSFAYLIKNQRQIKNR